MGKIEDKLYELKRELVCRSSYELTDNDDGTVKLKFGPFVHIYKKDSVELDSFLDGALSAIILYKNMLAYGHVNVPEIAPGTVNRGYIDNTKGVKVYC
jgi:hypothetical protein